MRTFQPLIDVSLAEFDEDGRQVVFPISPFGASETRAERIARLEAMGSIAPDCAACREFYEHKTLDPFAPRHTASGGCRSGKRAHCTCDGCF